jgi:hypothetical protein
LAIQFKGWMSMSATAMLFKWPKVPGCLRRTSRKSSSTFPHVANLNWQEAEPWKKDGSLVVSIVTMIETDGASITTTRTVVLGFDRAGKASIAKSTIKYQTARD